MRTLLLGLGLGLVFSLTSCLKENFGQYQTQEEEPYTPPSSLPLYTNGGTLTTPTTSTSALVGTTWVLTKYVSGFSTVYPDDTIRFVNRKNYTVNGGAFRTYTLNALPLTTNYGLSFYHFFPFGGSHYSGQVGQNFINSGVIDNTTFINTESGTVEILATFKRI